MEQEETQFVPYSKFGELHDWQVVVFVQFEHYDGHLIHERSVFL